MPNVNFMREFKQATETIFGDRNPEIGEGLAAEVAKAEKGRNLAGEIITTLAVNIERGNLPDELLERVQVWKRRLEECGG